MPVTWTAAIGNGSPNSAMQIWDADNQPSCEIVPSCVPGSANMAIRLTDNDDESNTCSYMPAIIIPSLGNCSISLDPEIINKP